MRPTLSNGLPSVARNAMKTALLRSKAATEGTILRSEHCRVPSEGWDTFSNTKVTFSKGMARSAFQVLFELLRKLKGFKGCVKFDLPRSEFYRVKAFATV